jgi:hypothetical protein
MEANARAKNVFVLAVSLTIKPGTLGLFKERWGVLAEHCRSGAEPNCLSYELCVKEGTDESAAGVELLIYERYVSKADLEGTHNASAPFKAFGCVARSAPRASAARAPLGLIALTPFFARCPQKVAERGERDRARKKQGHLH